MTRIAVPTLLIAGLIPLLAACDDDGTGPERLTAEEVQGIYQVCELRFDPTAGFLEDVDIRAAAFELQNPDVSRPRVFLNATRTFELEYTPKGQFSDVEIPGTFDLTPTEVRIRFPAGTSLTAASALLLPERVTLEFQRSTRVFAASAQGPYTVTRDDYARLAGLTPEERNQLTEQIEGRLSARLAPNCS